MLAYHLAIPKVLLRHGGWTPLSFWSHAGDPMQAEMLYLLGLAYGRATLAQWVHVYFEILYLATAGFILSRWSTKTVALTAMAIVACQDAVLYVAGTANTDFAVGVFAVSAFWFWTRWRESADWRWMALAGAFSGLAAGTKHTGLAHVGALAVLTVWELLVRRGGRSWIWAAKSLLAALLSAAAFAAPWYFRNYYWWGNPIWPMFPSWWGGSTAEVQLFDRLRVVGEGVPKDLLHFLALPYYFVFEPGRFRHETQYIWIPFFFLIILRAAAAMRRNDARDFLPPWVRWMLVYSFLFIAFWFLLPQNARYLIPIFPWLAGCIAWICAELRLTKPFALRICSGCFALCLAPIVWISPNNEGFALLGVRSISRPDAKPDASYLRLAFPPYPAFEWINARLSSNDRVLLFDEVRGYYLDVPYLWGDPHNELAVGFYQIQTAEELWARMMTLRITHVLTRDRNSVVIGPATPYGARAFGLMEKMLERHGIVEFQSADTKVYSLH